jgi:hypothetical protein
MSDLAERLAQKAYCSGVPLDRVLLLHQLEGVLRRWAASVRADDLVLGGSLLTQRWVGLHRRTAQDLDFVALFPHDVAAAVGCFREVLAIDLPDGVEYDPAALRGEATWQDMPFPGVRIVFPARLLGRPSEVRIDLGFGYPLIPPAWRMDYPCLLGPAASVPALRPELLAAWKLDGLFERGRSRWRAKGLFDLYLLTRYVALDRDLLLEAIRVSFASKAIPLERVLSVVYSRAWWEKEASQNKWARFRAGCGYPAPESLLEVAGFVARRLLPTLKRLLAFPADRTWPGET